MDRDELINLITTEDIIEILKDLGSNNYKLDDKGNIYFNTVCHNGDSNKLYYFSDTKFFQCFTCCGSLSLFDVVMSAKGIDFIESYNYICNFKGISRFKKLKIGLQKREVQNKDLDFLKFHLYKKENQIIQLPTYDKYILNIFDDYVPLSWYKEGINDEIALFFQIKFYISQNKTIIPHYDINGNLIGIRGRAFFKHETENGKKYMPVTIQNLTYRHPIQYNLYGIFQNQENIRKIKKAILFESEKSVMLYGSYFGQENNISLALCGMSFSLYQRDLLLSLGVEEVTICFDKQYQIELIDDKNIDKNSKVWREYENYIKRLIKISEILMLYCNISVVTCWDKKLNYKDAPIDHGKEIFEQLYRERYYIDNIEELKEMIK